MDIPSVSQFRAGYLAFQQRERRDAMYKTASFLIQHFWGRPADIADGLGVLLLTWNQAFYRYGSFDFEKLEECLATNQHVLDLFRPRSILSYSRADKVQIEPLFQQLLRALQICDGKKAGTTSPVAVAKALHLLAPAFFPLWDAKIAYTYGCYYTRNPSEKYLVFLQKMKDFAVALDPAVSNEVSKKTLLKLIDEYNYAKFTKEWV